jgi:hypothetical protein
LSEPTVVLTLGGREARPHLAGGEGPRSRLTSDLEVLALASIIALVNHFEGSRILAQA